MELFDINTCELEGITPWFYQENEIYYPKRYYLNYCLGNEEAYDRFGLEVLHESVFIKHQLSPEIYRESEFIIFKKTSSIEQILLHLQWISFHMQNWYHDLEEYTFPSILIHLDNTDINILSGLHVSDSLENKIRKHSNFIRDGVFVRLSTLSPKHYEKITDVETVITVLQDSVRVQASLHESFPTDYYLVLRKYQDLDHGFEFRCFIYKGQLTAISQYYYHTMNPSLQDNIYVNKIKKKIKLFFDNLNHNGKLIYEDCVADVYIDPQTDVVTLIEFNSFGPESRCGSGLYNWYKDAYILYDTTSVDIRVNRRCILDQQLDF
jgi:hypothetical protein